MAQEEKKNQKKGTQVKSTNKKNNSKSTIKKNVSKTNSAASKSIPKKVIESKKEENVKEVVKEIYSQNEEKKDNTTNYKRNYLIMLLVGIVIGLLIMLIFIPERIAKLENGQEVIVQVGDENITADDLYKDMKEYYSVNLLLNKVDEMLLSKIYPEDNDLKTEVNEMADYYISMYETYYGYTEEQFLEANGFSNRDEFLDALKLDYRRNKCYEDYVNSLITEEEINNYYNTKVFGEIATKYIAVAGTDDESKELALEIVNKLNNGISYDDIALEYGDRITAQDLGYVSFKDNLDDSYISTLKSLEEYTYSVNPVVSDTDYKIIFKSETKEKANLDDIKNDIIEILTSKKKEEDQTLAYKALIEMRKNNNVSFKDTDLSKKYDEYVKSYTEQ